MSWAARWAGTVEDGEENKDDGQSDDASKDKGHDA